MLDDEETILAALRQGMRVDETPNPDIEQAAAALAQARANYNRIDEPQIQPGPGEDELQEWARVE